MYTINIISIIQHTIDIKNDKIYTKDIDFRIVKKWNRVQEGNVFLMKYYFIVKWEREDRNELEACMKSISAGKGSETAVLVVDTFVQPEKDAEEDGSEQEKGNDRQEAVEALAEKINIRYCKGDFCGIEVLQQIDIDHETYYLFMDEYDRMSKNWRYQMEANPSKAELIICHSIYRRDNGRLFKFNLSLSEICQEVGKDKLIRGFFLCGGEDRFLTELNHKFISGHLLEKILSEYDEDGESALPLGAIVNFLAFICCDSVYYNTSCFAEYGLKKEAGIYNRPCREYIESLRSRLAYFEAVREKRAVSVPENWRQDWYREARSRLCVYQPSRQSEIYQCINEAAGEEIQESVNTGYFESLTTDFVYSYDYYNKILAYISGSECEYVGFDLFDTLIQRPFWEPTDLFVLLDGKYNELVGKKTVIDFSLIRKEGEQGCRAYRMALAPANEDVTLDQIYAFISEHYGISREIADELKEYEISLEKRYCSARKIGKELYGAARYYKKKILVVSDMYLPEYQSGQLCELQKMRQGMSDIKSGEEGTAEMLHGVGR